MKLNSEQRKIIELEPAGPMLVKGVAGSGKTTVAIWRIPFLMNNYCPEKDDRILLITFNKTLLNYIKHQYQKVEEDTQLKMDMLFNQDVDVEISTIDKIMYRYYQRHLKEEKRTLQVVDNRFRYKTIIEVLHKMSEQYPDVKTLTPKNGMFLLDEIDWIKACNIQDLETYQNVDRIGRGNGGHGNPQKLIKNSSVRKAIFETMEAYDQALDHENLIDFKTLNIFALEQAQQNPEKMYTHIIVDESQDLTKVQLDFIKCVYQEKKYSSMMFVADNTQSIYGQSWLGKGRPYTTIGFDMVGKSRVLSKNYRTTTQISEAAYDLIEKDELINANVDFVKPSLMDRQGHAPIYRFFKNHGDQLDFLEKEIESLQGEYAYSDICIVGRVNRVLESVFEGLKEKGLPVDLLRQQEFKYEEDSVKFITMHSIKGLEFKVIFLINLDEGTIPNETIQSKDDDLFFESEERKLLYVGMTRANELLYMSSVKKPSKFIHQIHRDHLKMRRDTKIRPFQSIGIQGYQFKDRIVDINSREEVVRQWMINELHEIYNYPLEMMELEVPVQQYSKRGYVDLEVSVYPQDDKIPYIFFEVKPFGAGIEEAKDQLKSYLEAEPNARYGVATDGLELLVIERGGEEIRDIPGCQNHLLPQDKDLKTYKNFKNRKEYLYGVDKENRANIEIKEKDSQMTVEYNQLKEIPLVGEVAAGSPVIADEHYEDLISLPEEWLLNPKSAFALRITGDSMRDAGIEKGDLVVVNQQSRVANNDIVVAVIGNDATVKKFMQMGDTVLLIPENANYEPIQMNQEDVLINGKVIGVLKEG